MESKIPIRNKFRIKVRLTLNNGISNQTKYAKEPKTKMIISNETNESKNINKTIRIQL